MNNIENKERTRDVYEAIAAYTGQPTVPLPDHKDYNTWSELGIKITYFSRAILKFSSFITGFSSFQKKLPATITRLLRTTDLRSGALYAPVVSASLVLEDDPRCINAIVRAATLICAAKEFYEELMSGKLEPDRYKEHILEMGQYPNLFGTSQVIEKKRARIFKSTNTTRIIIALYRRFYVLEIGERVTVEQLREALVELVLQAQKKRVTTDEPSPGILTAASNRTQIKIFTNLQRRKLNRQSLETIKHSFLTLCLDLDCKPQSAAEAMLVAHSGNPQNRWYHSALQIVVFGNARACLICNYSTYIDGNTMMRSAAEFQQRAIKYSIEVSTGKRFTNLPPANELKWKIHPRFIRMANRDFREIMDNQQATFEIKNIGRSFFAAHNIDPVSAFIFALQLTTDRFTGRITTIAQFLSMSKYCCMGLATTEVTTPETIKFLKYFTGEKVDHTHAMNLLRLAINSHLREYRKARKRLHLSDVIFLFWGSRKGFARFYVPLIIGITIKILALLGLYSPPRREVIISHPQIFKEVPLVGRPGVRLPYGMYYGLHYQIMENKIVITMMPSRRWKIPNVEFIAVLQENLKRLQALIRGDNDTKFGSENIFT